MDAVEFIREEIRMCASYQDCTGCPLYDTGYCSVSPKKRTQEEASEIAQRVEKWAAAHPRKTRQSEFLENYPTAQIDENGYLEVCPCALCDTYRDKYGGCANYGVGCSECRKDFWLKEVE